MRLTFLVRSGRRQRLTAAGEMPTEFFYGYPQLAAQGVDAHLVEDAEIGMGPPLPWFAAMVNRLAAVLVDLPVGMALSFTSAGGARRLEKSGTLIATTNGMGWALAMSKAAGLLQAPVVLLAMGLLSSSPGRLRKWLYGRLLARLHLVCISKGERDFLRRHFPKQTVHYVPFGVDAAYWCPSPAIPNESDYVLAIGNDPHRDWATLVAAWSPELPRLKIVTSLPVPPGPANVEVIRGDWRSQVLSDDDIRRVYWGARFVIVPLRETIQPSGQSACLQAMACGKAVILSDIAGLWDRELMVDGETVLLTPPGDAAALAERVGRLVRDRDLADRLGCAGRHLVETRLNTDRMAEALLRLMESLHV